MLPFVTAWHNRAFVWYVFTNTRILYFDLEVAAELPSNIQQAINYGNNGDRAKRVIQELTTTIPSTTTSTPDSSRFELFRADVGDRPSVQKLVQDTLATFGRIDVVVSNAGWARITNFLNLEEGMVDEVRRRF